MPPAGSTTARLLIAGALAMSSSAALGGPSTATAAEIRAFGPVADAYVTSAAPAGGFHGRRRLVLDAEPTMRAYLRFEVRQVTGKVTRATLLLRPLRRSHAGYEVRDLGAARWLQRRITYRRAPRLGPRIGASGPFTAGRRVAIDVTSAVRGNGTVSFALVTRSRHAIPLASREAGARSAPRLEVEFTAATAPAGTPPAGTPPAGTPPAGTPPDATGVGQATSPDPPDPVTPPDAERPPVIQGTAEERQALVADPGDWVGRQPIEFTYQWRRCKPDGTKCEDVPHATDQTYVLTALDVGATIRVVVTGSNAAGSSTATSSPTGVVSKAPDPPAATKPPAISGIAQDGGVLKADPGTWTGSEPISLAYQWRRCDTAGAACADIAGATASTYLVTAAEIGTTIRVAVSGSNVAASSEVSSKQTKVVSAAPPASSGTVGLWHMNETSGKTMFDSSGHGNNGSISSVTLNQPGVLGSAYLFNGITSIVSVSSNSSINPGYRDFAVELNLKFTSKPPGDSYDPIRKGYSNSAGGDFKMEISPGGRGLCYFRGSSGSGEVSSGSNLADGNWHRIRCVKTSSSIRIEVDGNSNSNSASIGSISNGAKLTVGSKLASEDNFKGLIDEVSMTVG